MVLKRLKVDLHLLKTEHSTRQLSLLTATNAAINTGTLDAKNQCGRTTFLRQI
jgi:hypothetical protein